MAEASKKARCAKIRWLVIVKHARTCLPRWMENSKLLGKDRSKRLHVEQSELTHWGWVMHICVSDLTLIDSDNGLPPGRRQAIIRTNAAIMLIRPLGTNFSEILIKILIFSFKKMRLKVSSAQWRQCVKYVCKISCCVIIIIILSKMLPLLILRPWGQNKHDYSWQMHSSVFLKIDFDLRFSEPYFHFTI